VKFFTYYWELKVNYLSKSKGGGIEKKKVMIDSKNVILLN